MRAVTVDEMRWYFEQLRASSLSDVERLNRCRRAFSTPRSQVIYGLWKHDGEAALVSVSSDAISQAVETGRAGSKCSNSATGTAISLPWLPSPDIQRSPFTSSGYRTAE